MSLPLSLEIVGTDRSHTEAGSVGADLNACRSVANDPPILGRLFTPLPSSLCVVLGSVLTAHLFSVRTSKDPIVMSQSAVPALGARRF